VQNPYWLFAPYCYNRGLLVLKHVVPLYAISLVGAYAVVCRVIARTKTTSIPKKVTTSDIELCFHLPKKYLLKKSVGNTLNWFETVPLPLRPSLSRTASSEIQGEFHADFDLVLRDTVNHSRNF